MAAESQDTMSLINTILLKGIDVAQKTGDFVVEQAPDVVRQFLLWNITNSILWILFSSIMVFLYIKISVYLYKNWKLIADNNAEPIAGFYFLFGGIMCIAFSISFFCNLSNLLKLLIAPKLYLLEYAAALVKH